MTDEQSTGVMAWWTALCVVSVANICAWTVLAWLRRREIVHGDGDGGDVALRRWQLLLSALFVLGCAFRSALPRAEGQRICLYDSWLSSALIGRWVATVAELSLVAQWSLVLREYARSVAARWGVIISRLLLPLITVAELFSWYTTLTTNFIGSVFEESIWAATSALMTAVLIAVWRRQRGPRRGTLRRFLGVSIVLNAAYVVFMCTVDVPMYFSRWRAQEASGWTYLSVGEGWEDAGRRRIVTRRWQDWHQEIPWMSLYFSVGVWISLSLNRAPLPDPGPAPSSEAALAGRAAGRSRRRDVISPGV